MQPETSRTRLWLYPILLGSFALRLWLATADLQELGDERINLANVAALLQGSVRPANGWYQGLSYLPQAALLALSRELQTLTGWEALAVTSPGGFTPWAIFLCRLLQTIYGTLALLATYFLGRKLFPEGAAIFGMFLLAVTPRHLNASTIFKPDILLLLWTVVAFVWILEALEHPGLRRYVLAGLGVGLCMATKLNGGLVAVPFAVGTVPLLGRVRRIWLWLISAGVAAAAVFLLFNPFLGMQVDHFKRNLEHYESRARTTHLEAFLQVLAFPFSDSFHGRLIGLAAVLGGGWMALSTFRCGWRDVRGLQQLVFLSYPLFYSVLYAAVTTRAKQNHFLQILPFSSLLAASFLLGALSRASGRFRQGGWAPAKRAVLFLFVGWLAIKAVIDVYELVVPENLARVSWFLHRKMPPPWRGRLTYAEGEVSPELRVTFPGGLHSVDPLENLSPKLLDLADAEIFPLSAERNAFYRNRIAASGPLFRFTSRPFVGRGKGMGVLLHPWTLAGSRPGTVRLLRRNERRWLAGALPLEVAPGEVISLRLWLPRRWPGKEAVLIAGGKRLPLAWIERKGRQVLYLSPRFVRDARGPVVLRIPAERNMRQRRIEFTVYRWSNGQSTPQHP